MTDVISKEHPMPTESCASQREGGPMTTDMATDKTANPPSGDESPSVDGGERLPPQLHAGKVGYGPNYHQGPGVSEKITGFKEEIIGTVKKDQALKQHGRDLRTGELKRRQEAEDQDPSAFINPAEKQRQQSTAERTDPQEPGVFTEGDEPGKRVGEDRTAMGNP